MPTSRKQVLAKAKANPDDFGALARKYSKDPTSASLNGLIQPIRRHVGDPKIEEAAFNLKEGEDFAGHRSAWASSPFSNAKARRSRRA